MERRHIAEGEQRVVRQEMLVSELIEKRREQIVLSSLEILSILRESLELSRARLRDLEECYGSK